MSSYEDPRLNADQFTALHAHLAQRYPKVHATLTREVVGDFSLLYRWEGSDPNLAPIRRGVSTRRVTFRVVG